MLTKKQNVFDKIYDHQKPRGLALVLGKGLVTSKGEIWKRQRQLIQPMFHKSQISSLASVITTVAETQFQDWAKYHVHEPVDVHELMMRLTLEVITRSMFSSSVDVDTHRRSAAMNTALNFSQSNFFNPFALPLYIPTRGNRDFNQAMRYIRSLIADLIEQRRNADQPYDDLLSVFLHARDANGKPAMDDDQVFDETITIFTAGHETTAAALSWTWFLLAQHPEIEAKLHIELDTALGGKTPTLDDLPKLPWTKAVLETLSARRRAHPARRAGHGIGWP